MGAAASLISNDRRQATRVAIHEALPVNLYPLEEKNFSKGSFFDGDKSFADQRAHVSVFETLGLHEWSVSQLWRHFRLVSEDVAVTCIFECYCGHRASQTYCIGSSRVIDATDYLIRGLSTNSRQCKPIIEGVKDNSLHAQH